MLIPIFFFRNFYPEGHADQPQSIQVRQPPWFIMSSHLHSGHSSMFIDPIMLLYLVYLILSFSPSIPDFYSRQF